MVFSLKDWSKCSWFRLEIKAPGKWCSRSLSEDLRLIFLESPKCTTSYGGHWSSWGFAMCFKMGSSSRNFPCPSLISWHNSVCGLAEQGMLFYQQNLYTPCLCGSGSLLDDNQIVPPLILYRIWCLQNASDPKYLTKCPLSLLVVIKLWMRWCNKVYNDEVL